MNKLSIYILLFFFVGFTSCILHAQNKAPSPPLAIVWEMGNNNPQKGTYSNRFILKNTSGGKLGHNWAVYYNQITRPVLRVENPGIKVEEVKPNLFRISPTALYQPLAMGDTLAVSFVCKGYLQKESHAPEAAYFVETENGKELPPVDLDIKHIPFNHSSQWEVVGLAQLPYPDGEYMYKQNNRFANEISLKQTDIFPSVKAAVPSAGTMIIDKAVALVFPPDFSSEAHYLKSKLKSLYGIGTEEKSAAKIRFSVLKGRAAMPNDEYYELKIENKEAEILAFSSHGAFNGLQTLLAMMKNQSGQIVLNHVFIQDYPDLLYRGFMLDVARNFTSKTDLLKLIDKLSSYKINVLHLHLSDDEGWRIQIPGLEELTTVASQRAHTQDESRSLYPNYSGGAYPSAVSSGFYSVEDFKEILRYAKDRHIRVIPEIDFPGHSRAAIVAMKARYNQYISLNRKKAEEYLLSDATDLSVYTSAQGYSDNVINVALPSAYRFVDKVMAEIKNMYSEAGISLESFHIGGDEVPKGAWEKSEACLRLMKEKNIGSADELEDYFIAKVGEIARLKGLKISAWQEAGLHRDETVNPQHLGKIDALYCWNTLPDWQGDHIPYSLANAGYDVILCNLTNFYFDLAYNKHPSEPGHTWAGYQDEYTSFNMLPYQVYQSTHTDLSGVPFDLNRTGEGKPQLTEEAKHRIRGVQGQLFSETIRSFNMVEYYIFPKLFGLAERGWNTSPSWANSSDWNDNRGYAQALTLYNAKISQKELPQLRREGINFRLSQPGIIIRDGLLYANSAIQGAEIRYTTDGSTPTALSPLWIKPVPCQTPLVLAKLFYQGKESVVTRLEEIPADNK